jgi:hypothetical protein
MVPDKVRRVLEDLLPWYDRAAEARHDERSDYIHERSIEVRIQNEEAITAGRNRIRDAYKLADQRVKR